VNVIQLRVTSSAFYLLTYLLTTMCNIRHGQQPIGCSPFIGSIDKVYK